MERIYRIIPDRPLLPVPARAPLVEREPSLLEEGAAHLGVIFLALCGVVLIATAVGCATGAIYFVPAAELATWEAAPGIAGALGIKLVPEVAGAATAAALA